MLESLKAWSFRTFAGKAVKRFIRVVIAAAASHVPQTWGVNINTDAAFVAAWGGVEALANIVKTKSEGTKWAWVGKWVF